MKLTGVLDAALDRSVVLGYTKIGSRAAAAVVARRPTAEGDGGQARRRHGATSGLGEAMAKSFAELGATVHLLGRNPEKVKALRGRRSAARCPARW